MSNRVSNSLTLTPEEFEEKLGACKCCGWKRDPRVARKPGTGKPIVVIKCKGVDRATRIIEPNTSISNHHDCPIKIEARNEKKAEKLVL
jgi:hypothetical protein